MSECWPMIISDRMLSKVPKDTDSPLISVIELRKHLLSIFTIIIRKRILLGFTRNEMINFIRIGIWYEVDKFRLWKIQVTWALRWLGDGPKTRMITCSKWMGTAIQALSQNALATAQSEVVFVSWFCITFRTYAPIHLSPLIWVESTLLTWVCCWSDLQWNRDIIIASPDEFVVFSILNILTWVNCSDRAKICQIASFLGRGIESRKNQERFHLI